MARTHSAGRKPVRNPNVTARPDGGSNSAADSRAESGAPSVWDNQYVAQLVARAVSALDGPELRVYLMALLERADDGTWTGHVGRLSDQLRNVRRGKGLGRASGMVGAEPLPSRTLMRALETLRRSGRIVEIQRGGRGSRSRYYGAVYRVVDPDSPLSHAKNGTRVLHNLSYRTSGSSCVSRAPIARTLPNRRPELPTDLPSLDPVLALCHHPPMPDHAVTLTTAPLEPADVLSVARRDARVTIHADAVGAMRAAREIVDAALTDGLAHYGINTGFGSLSRQRIPQNNLRELQHNLLRSHAAGLGEPLPRDVVRAMMLLSAASLSRGHSGVRPDLPAAIVGLLNAGITPFVPETGSVGASGDLAPLAAMALVITGEGEAIAPDGRRVNAREALARAGITPIALEAKEGLALINGTHLMAAQAALLCHDTDALMHAACIAGAISIDAARGTDEFLDPRVHALRRQPGQAEIARRLRSLLEGSEIIPSHQTDDPRVQDPYSLRCIPPVLGAALDCLGYVKSSLHHELGAVTDNPLVFPESAPPAILSAGNFHGMPLAIPLDALTIAIAAVAGIAERRVFWILSAFDPEARLTPYLSPKPGLHSGLMIAQYTAAACCNEIVGLAHPASVANIPTSAEVEDFNSFGPRAAAKARRAIDLARGVVAIELVCAAEGVERHRPLRSGRGVEQALSLVRSVVPPLTADRPLTPDIEAVRTLIAREAFGAVKA